MPLRSSNEPDRYEFNAERVRFEMVADNARAVQRVLAQRPRAVASA